MQYWGLLSFTSCSFNTLPPAIVRFFCPRQFGHLCRTYGTPLTSHRSMPCSSHKHYGAWARHSQECVRNAQCEASVVAPSHMQLAARATSGSCLVMGGVSTHSCFFVACSQHRRSPQFPAAAPSADSGALHHFQAGMLFGC